MYHAYENANLMEEIVVEINGGITINADVSVKNVMYVKKKKLFEIVLYAVAKMENT